MRRRERVAKPAESPTADADLIEQEILEEERRFQEAQRQASRKWARRMGSLFFLGLAAALLMLLTAAKAKAPDLVVVASLISAVANTLSSYAIRKGGAGAPNAFPVRWLSATGRVKGENYTLGVAAFSGAVALFAICYMLFEGPPET